MFATMNHLKSLHIVCGCKAEEKFAEIVAHIAGRVPFLERFSFSVKKSYLAPFGKLSSSFIDQYSKYYPHKKLILEKHR